MRALEQWYQPADQIALYRMQLKSRQQGLKETLGELVDEVEWLVRLAYPNMEGDIADDLAQDSFVTSLGNGELQRWVHQARPASFAEARAATLQGEAFFHGEKEQGMVRNVNSATSVPWLLQCWKV